MPRRNYTGWSAQWSGTWSAANNYLRMTPGSAATIAKANTDNDNEVRFSYVCNDTSNAGYPLTVSPRYASSGDRIYVNILPGSINLAQRVSGVWSSLNTSATSSTQGTEYTIRVECDGQDVTVYRTAPGALEAEILSTTSCTVVSTNNVSFTPSANADYSIDNIRILSDDLSNTTTFAVNNANELTSMTDYNGSTTFGFDAWGRMTSKARGSYAAAYGYRYGQMLRSVTSDFPGEGDVTYEYGGDLKRRQRQDGGGTTKFRLGLGASVLNEEDADGTLASSWFGRFAEVIGTTPASGQYRYYEFDNLRSIRKSRGQDKTLLGEQEFAPYGKDYGGSGLGATTLYASLHFDSAADMYFAPYRYFSAQSARWISTDPAGFEDGPNLYTYVLNNPVNYLDPYGLLTQKKRARKADCRANLQNELNQLESDLGQCIPDDVKVKVKNLPPRTDAMAPRRKKDVIWVDLDACERLAKENKGLRCLLLHEMGHLEDDFSRPAYVCRYPFSLGPSLQLRPNTRNADIERWAQYWAEAHDPDCENHRGGYENLF